MHINYQDAVDHWSANFLKQWPILQTKLLLLNVYFYNQVLTDEYASLEPERYFGFVLKIY